MRVCTECDHFVFALGTWDVWQNAESHIPVTQTFNRNNYTKLLCNIKQLYLFIRLYVRNVCYKLSQRRRRFSTVCLWWLFLSQCLRHRSSVCNSCRRWGWMEKRIWIDSLTATGDWKSELPSLLSWQALFHHLDYSA